MKFLKDLTDSLFIVAVFSFITELVNYTLDGKGMQLLFYFIIFSGTSILKTLREE